MEYMSRPARGAWSEILALRELLMRKRSRPARGAWIEISTAERKRLSASVAPRKGRVD